jgi:hypothetical protein
MGSAGAFFACFRPALLVCSSQRGRARPGDWGQIGDGLGPDAARILARGAAMLVYRAQVRMHATRSRKDVQGSHFSLRAGAQERTLMSASVRCGILQRCRGLGLSRVASVALVR